jgi:hypothetical protein
MYYFALYNTICITVLRCVCQIAYGTCSHPMALPRVFQSVYRIQMSLRFHTLTRLTGRWPTSVCIVRPLSLNNRHFATMPATSHAPLSVAIIGVGLVGSELISQLLSLPSPSPFTLVSLSSSKRTVYSPDGLQVNQQTWSSTLSSSAEVPNLDDLANKLSKLERAVVVDNSASPAIADSYPEFLRRGIHVVTPNKKAFSGSQKLYDEILKASRDGGARWLNESTVGAGLPVVQTLKDMVASGDKVCSLSTIFLSSIECDKSNRFTKLKACFRVR